MTNRSESLSLIQLESMIRYALSRPSYEYAKPIEDYLYWEFREKGTPEIFDRIDSISRHFKEQNADLQAERIARMVMERMAPKNDLRTIKVNKEQIANAICQVMPLFAVGRQWVGIYRILVDFCGYPKEITEFCNAINALPFKQVPTFPCDYQAIQKPLAGIYTKSYDDWCKYRPGADKTVFNRQKRVADELLRLLKEAEKEINKL